MSLLDLAKSNIKKPLPVPSLARMRVEVNSDIRVSENGNSYINILLHGKGEYSASRIYERIMLVVNGEWSPVGIQRIACIAAASGHKPAETILGSEPQVNDASMQKLVALIDDGEAIIKTRKGKTGYNEAAYFVDPTGLVDPSGPQEAEKLGSLNALDLTGSEPKTETKKPDRTAADDDIF